MLTRDALSRLSSFRWVLPYFHVICCKTSTSCLRLHGASLVAQLALVYHFGSDLADFCPASIHPGTPRSEARTSSSVLDGPSTSRTTKTTKRSPTHSPAVTAS